MTRAGMRGVCIPAFPVCVSHPGSALQNQEWSFLLYALSKMLIAILFAELREWGKQAYQQGCNRE